MVVKEHQPNAKVARREHMGLTNVVDKIAMSKSMPDFPRMCFDVARQKLVPLIDRWSVKDNLVVSRREEAGKDRRSMLKG